MIVRGILENPSLADNFDYFNDYHDTMGWLLGLGTPDFMKNAAVNALAQGHQQWEDEKAAEAKPEIVGLIFSARCRLAEQAEKWCEENNAPISPFNIVTALDSMGKLKAEAAEKEFVQEHDNLPWVSPEPTETGKKPSIPPFPTGRQSGRTQWMIDRLVEAIEDGEPRCYVVARNYEGARLLMLRAVESIHDKGISITPRGDLTLEAKSSIVEFTTTHQLTDNKRRGNRRFIEFWDHLAEGID